MKKTLLAGLATVLFLLTSTGIAMAGDDAKNKTDSNNSKATGLYDNVTILQEQINSLTERIGRIETLLETGRPRFTDMGDGTIRDNDSGLIWLKNANCFGWRDWEVARILVSDLHDDDEDPDCGLTDGSSAGQWRLPTKNEWDAFMSKVYIEPALVNTRGDGQWAEGDAFTGLSMWDVNIFWSKSEALAGAAWIAVVDDGGVGPSSHVNPWGVWPVRSVNW
jgi:hypothetical protein